MQSFRLSILFSFFLSCLVFGQVAAQRDTIYTDTVQIDETELRKHSPTTASLLSAVLPGAGQVYNKKYWKVPIIYAGLGVCTYYALEQHGFYEEKKDAYLNRLAGDSSDVFLESGNFYSNEALLESLDINRRNRDLMIILDVTIYLLQIVDASVDAHLFYFNVSDDLSLHYRPNFLYDERRNTSNIGLSLNLYF